MDNFKRSPSKVWWAEEHPSSWRHRSSASPGSQDSGFSDTEQSPPTTAPAQEENCRQSTPQKTTKRIPKDIFKNISNHINDLNLSGRFREKRTPTKNFVLEGEKLSKTVAGVEKNTPVTRIQIQALSEPLQRQIYQRRSTKVSKSLFTSRDSLKDTSINQYAGDASTTYSNTSSQCSYEISDNSSVSDVRVNRTLPLVSNKNYTVSVKLNKSAPAVLEVLKEDECVEAFTKDDLSDSDSELETLFRGSLESPKHTSTPKTGPCEKMRHRRKKSPLYLKYRQEKATRNIVVTENPAVHRWIQEIKQSNEPECLTSLQCKSICMELGEKVLHLASRTTSTIRYVLSYSQAIEKEFDAIRRETKYMGPLAQNLAGSVKEFLDSCGTEDSKLYEQTDALRRASVEEIPKLVAQLYKFWRPFLREILVKEVGFLVDKLENPASELDLRATITGLTSLCLRQDDLIAFFVEAGAVSTLLILCEKCDGSSVRALILRALTTLCCTSKSIRQLETTSGIQVITDILQEISRPEPERSEAAALLAQITAPWIEDNHSVHGLHEESSKIIKGLTEFVSSTKCCQNLLLCAAALANLTAMDVKCIKHVLHRKTIRILFDAVRQRGPRASVYLLEQVATLVANLSSTEEGRKQLTMESAPTVLLCFLKANEGGEEVEKRLQQRAIIALSRLCGDREAAEQLVEAGGVQKLVRLCREKGERYDSDAVLVAALATLRKITDVCGSSVINAQDAQELVEPRLLDSFLAYSTQNESYV